MDTCPASIYIKIKCHVKLKASNWYYEVYKTKEIEYIENYYDFIMIICYDIKLTNKHSITKMRCNSLT